MSNCVIAVTAVFDSAEETEEPSSYSHRYWLWLLACAVHKRRAAIVCTPHLASASGTMKLQVHTESLTAQGGHRESWGRTVLLEDLHSDSSQALSIRSRTLIYCLRTAPDSAVRLSSHIDGWHVLAHEHSFQSSNCIFQAEYADA